MRQRVLLSATFTQLKFGSSSFRVLVVTHSSRCGLWKPRKTMSMLITLGCKSIPCQTPMRCRLLYLVYSRTLRTGWGWLLRTSLVKVRRVNRQFGSTLCRTYHLHLRLEWWSDRSTKLRYLCDGRYVNLNWSRWSVVQLSLPHSV